MSKKIGIPQWPGMRSDAAPILSEEIAIKYCISEILFYEDAGVANRRRWKFWQYSAIALGSLATIIGTMPDSAFEFVRAVSGADAISAYAGWVRGVPAALATVATTILGVYNFKSEHVRYGLTHDALQGELALFLCRATPYDRDDDPGSTRLSKFMQNIRTIIRGELALWRSATTKEEETKQNLNEPPKQQAPRADHTDDVL